jgi:hypothetical protein
VEEVGRLLRAGVEWGFALEARTDVERGMGLVLSVAGNDRAIKSAASICELFLLRVYGLGLGFSAVKSALSICIFSVGGFLYALPFTRPVCLLFLLLSFSMSSLPPSIHLFPPPPPSLLPSLLPSLPLSLLASLPASLPPSLLLPPLRNVLFLSAAHHRFSSNQPPFLLYSFPP